MLPGLLAGFVLAVLAPALTRARPHLAGWILAALPALQFLYCLSLVPQVARGEPLLIEAQWVPSLQITATLLVDGLSLLFALLITGIGAVTIAFAGLSESKDPRLGRLLGLMLAFCATMLGLVLAADLVTLVIFWEGTAIASFLLIGHHGETHKARRGAVQALAVTGLGGLALLAAVVLIIAGTGETALLSSGAEGQRGLLAMGPDWARTPEARLVLILILIAGFSKSAQVPLHSWLANAMAAPTPVSALLHSATMVKAGIYLLARLQPVFGATTLYIQALALAGALTFLLGGVLALRARQAKPMLAWTTVASLGLILLLLSRPGADPAHAGFAYLLAHALFKAPLFLVAGILDKATGTAELSAWRGLGRSLPLTAAIAALAGASMAGLPPFLGFAAKEALGETALGLPGLDAYGLGGILILGNALLVLAAWRIAIRPFWSAGPATPLQKTPPKALALLAALPALLGLGLGLLLPLAEFLLSPAATSIAGLPPEAALHAIPKDWLAPAVTLATLAAGGALILGEAKARLTAEAMASRIPLAPDRAFDRLIEGLIRLAQRLRVWVQSGDLKRYMLVTILTAALAMLAPLLTRPWTALRLPDLSLIPLEAPILMALTLAGAGAVVLARTKLQAILSVGLAGLPLGLLYVVLGAPDLGFTQLMVESLSVVLLTTILLRLPLEEQRLRDLQPLRFARWVAVLGGVAFALLIAAATAGPLPDLLHSYYDAMSYPAAHGRNIVNVIIVDFRGFDTLGEITVVTLAALSAILLLRLRPRRGD